jgi:hypothetical protein
VSFPDFSHLPLRIHASVLLDLAVGKPVNMIAVSLRVSAGLMLALSSDMAAIIGQAAGGCQTYWPGVFLAPERPKE